MKQIKNYIFEKLKLNKGIIFNNGKTPTKKTLFPKTREELDNIIFKECFSLKHRHKSLNHIDTSKITDMSFLFFHYMFDGDISEWDVSNVKDMTSMFEDSQFTGDYGSLENWNISEQCITNYIFKNCPIKNENKPKSLQD